MLRRATGFGMEAELLIHLVNAVDRIEKKLEALEGSTAEAEWLKPDEFMKLAGMTKEGLRYAIQKGTIHGDAIRNVGTAKRQHLRYHRVKAMDQYLKKLT